MSLFRRRKNRWATNVLSNETGIENEKQDESVAGDIIYRESSVLMNVEFAEDVSDSEYSKQGCSKSHKKDKNCKQCGCKNGNIANQEFGEDVNVGVTDNAPYHNMSDYSMILEQDEQNALDTQSS